LTNHFSQIKGLGVPKMSLNYSKNLAFESQKFHVLKNVVVFQISKAINLLRRPLKFEAFAVSKKSLQYTQNAIKTSEPSIYNRYQNSQNGFQKFRKVVILECF